MNLQIGHNLLLEIARYFQKSVDGAYYLREGYMFLPQDLIVRLKEYEQQSIVEGRQP